MKWVYYAPHNAGASRHDKSGIDDSTYRWVSSRLPQPLRATQTTAGPAAFGTTDRMPAV